MKYSLPCLCLGILVILSVGTDPRLLREVGDLAVMVKMLEM
jgi:hypothetical protein